MLVAGRLAQLGAGHTVFGPTLDALVRELAPRLDTRPAFRSLVEEWPFDADGTPQDADALFDRLLALRQGIGPVPLPAGQPAGSPGRALGGLLLGVAAALPVGFLAYLLLRELVLPTDLWSSDAVMWAVVAVLILGPATAAARSRERARLAWAMRCCAVSAPSWPALSRARC